MILDPVTLTDNAIVAYALNLMKEDKIGGIPIVSANKEWIGIVTNSDLRFEKNHKRSIKEVMTSKDLVITKEGVDFKKQN